MTEADPPAPADTPDEGDAEPTSSPHPDRRGRVLRLLGLSVLGLVVLGVAWVVVTGLMARSDLNDARARIGELRTAVVNGDLDRSAELVTSIRESTDSAASLTSGPAWWVSSHLPVIGSPLYTSREIASQSARLGDDVLPGVLRLARTLSDQARSGSADSVDLDVVASAAPQLHAAARTARSAYDTLRTTDGSWLPVVASARDSFVTQLARLDGELTGADRAVQVMLPMLGRDGRQRYFIGFLNEAESRGGGGLPGAFAIATADHGHIAFERFGSDNDLVGARADVQLGADIDARYRNNDITGTIQNSNLSPDFSVAARIWAGMWQDKTGEHIDGALALDPTALSYLLQVTGPATGPNGNPVGARDIVALTQQTQYVRYPGLDKAANAERKRYLTGLARAVSTRLTGKADPARLVRALSRAAGERRLTVWSDRPGIEQKIRAADWAGALGNTTGSPYSGFVVNNAAGSKLDYYLDRSMSYRRTSCAAGGTATATIRLTNDAPRTGLPAYVTYRADDAPRSARPGDNRLLVTYYADRSARITSLTVDGRSLPVTAQPEGDTLAVTTTVELPVRSTVTVTVTVAEPATSQPVQVLRQPLVRPISVDLRDDRCR